MPVGIYARVGRNKEVSQILSCPGDGRIGSIRQELSNDGLIYFRVPAEFHLDQSGDGILIEKEIVEMTESGPALPGG